MFHEKRGSFFYDMLSPNPFEELIKTSLILVGEKKRDFFVLFHRNLLEFRSEVEHHLFH